MMKLRKRKRSSLQASLKRMGMYEEGMDYQEMNDLMQVVEESAQECQTEFFDRDLEQALKESELDFAPMKRAMVDNDSHAMQLQQQAFAKKNDSSCCSSPEMPPAKIVVYAQVHHLSDWSPLSSRSALRNESLRLDAISRASTPLGVRRVFDIQPDDSIFMDRSSCLDENGNMSSDPSI